MNPRDENRENQAARIRWLLERADLATRMEFMLYALAHPFVSEDEEVSDAG